MMSEAFVAIRSFLSESYYSSCASLFSCGSLNYSYHGPSDLHYVNANTIA